MVSFGKSLWSGVGRGSHFHKGATFSLKGSSKFEFEGDIFSIIKPGHSRGPHMSHDLEPFPTRGYQ